MLRRLAKRVTLLLAVSTLTLLSVRIYDSQRGPELESWHTYRPHELNGRQLAELDWAGYLKAEDALFDEVRSEVTQKLDPDQRVPVNRYFEGSPVYPGNFSPDWNRSYVLEPDGIPVGAVVLLHGLTDSPYSLRHIARRYRELGYVAVAIRLPGHGTVPGSLADVEWEDWSEATRLAVREARRRARPSTPLHLVGYSTGGALAVQYALDAIDDEKLARPDRIVLISPMIGITRFARFAGLLGVPALLPPFAKAAWLSVLPEFNPFKYNSFPVNAALQSSLLARSLQQQLTRHTRDDLLVGLPPILTFQSVVDFTTEAGAVTEQSRAWGLVYPSDLFSLSHVAVPFPTGDGVYGMEPDPSEHFGVNLGAMAARGERGTLIVSLDFVSRTASNPFFPYLLERIESGIGDGHGGADELR